MGGDTRDKAATGGRGRRSFADLPIAARIASAVGVVAVVAVTMGVTGYMSTRNLEEGQQELYQERVVPLVLIGDIQREVQGSRARAMTLGFLDEGAREDQLAELDQREKDVLALVEDYEQYATPDAGPAAVKIAEFHEYVRTTWLDTIVNDHEDLTRLYQDEFYPMIDATLNLISDEAKAQADLADELNERGLPGRQSCAAAPLGHARDRHRRRRRRRRARGAPDHARDHQGRRRDRRAPQR